MAHRSDRATRASTELQEGLDHSAGIPCAAAQIDAWCKSRADNVSAQAEVHLKKGLPLNAPNYRTMLGEHRAYLAMRSFIHGMRLLG
jgi:hypothetical protein